DGDFVLPAPGGRDAAWLFGAETRFRDSYLREGEPRTGGGLLTASGLALGDIGPSMIWSGDGRYLALTRHVDRFELAVHQPRSDTDQWHLLLLDVQERSLRAARSPIGCMPHFLRFDADGLAWRTLPTDHEHADSVQEWQTRHMPLAALLSAPPARFEAHGPVWLQPGDAPFADQWQALDSRHLQRWR
ncbi:MAG: hypothetical protein QM581_06860, partial [Pseudomonas sp.]